jgi:hypothetical protein
MSDSKKFGTTTARSIPKHSKDLSFEVSVSSVIEFVFHVWRIEINVENRAARVSCVVLWEELSAKDL